MPKNPGGAYATCFSGRSDSLLTYVQGQLILHLTNGKGRATMQKEIREIVEEAQRQGWRVRPLKSGHVLLLAPDGKSTATLPGTPSDWRSLKNAIAEMRRAGFRWPPKRR